MDEKSDADEGDGVATLQPVDFQLTTADVSLVKVPTEYIDSTTFSKNTRFLNNNYLGEVAQFVHPWKKETVPSLEAESKSDVEERKDSKADHKEDSKEVQGIAIPDHLVYVEVVPELSAKAKRKLAIAKLSDEKQASSSDSDDDKSSSPGRRKSRRGDTERKSIRFSDDLDDYDDGDRRRNFDADSKSDRYLSDDKSSSSK